MAEPANEPRQEHRGAPRCGCAGEAELAVPECGLRQRGRIADLSTAGCFVETECRLERGTSVEVRMNVEGLPLRLAACLLVCRPNGWGLRFTQLTRRKVEQIECLIAELKAASSEQNT
jgi:hypothetical protein